MKNKELITEYINLRIQKYEIEQPYWDILSLEEITKLLDAHFQIEKFADRLLGINEIEEDTIQDFISWKTTSSKKWFSDTPDTVEELVDGIMDGRFKEDE